MSNLLAPQRIHWLDLARSLAIICVVLCHVDEKLYSFFTVEVIGSYSLQSKAFGLLSFSVARLGVPLFLMITGYLLLTRHYDDHGCVNFWKHRWLPLLLCVEVWNLLYALFLFSMGKPLEFASLLQSLFFLQAIKINHIWYLPMILGIYLTLPVFARALERLDPKTLLVPAAVSFFSFSIVPTMQPVMSLIGISLGNSLLDPGFGAGLYGLYLWGGWAVHKGAFRRIASRKLCGILVGCLVLLLIYELMLLSKGVSYFLWYSNSLLLLSSLCLFELLSRIERMSETAEKIASFLSRYSFAVYLTHYPLLMVLEPFAKTLVLPLPLLVAVCTFVLLMVSLGTSMLISKIPIVGKPLLYMR